MKKLLALVLFLSSFAAYADNVELGPEPNPTVVTCEMVVGAVTSAPAKGTVVTDTCRYWRYKQFLFMRWDYKQSAGGTAGTGTYLFPIPTGLTIKTADIGFDPAERTMGVVGKARSEAGTVWWDGAVHVYDATRLFCTGGHELNAPTYFSSSNTPLSTSDRSFSFQAGWIPIVEWGA